MASGNWSFDVSTWDGRAILLARGDLDMAATPDLREELRDALTASPHVLVEPSAVSFADSAALTALLDAQQHTEAFDTDAGPVSDGAASLGLIENVLAAATARVGGDAAGLVVREGDSGVARSETPARFGAQEATLALDLRTDAAVALSSTQQVRHLHRALEGRNGIGVAKGILMQKFDLDQRQAFEVLRRYSQDYNIKLRDLAADVATTRLPPGESGDGRPTDEFRSHPEARKG